MTKNNYIKANVTITLGTIFIILFLAWLFIPKDFLDRSGSKQFKDFRKPKSKAINDSVPGTLRWSDGFSKPKEEKRQGSYMQYLSEKNKANK